MHARVVDGDREIEHLRRKPPYGGQDRIRRDHAIVLRGDQRDPGVDQRLLGVQHVERGSLPGLGFFTHAVERDLGSGHLRLRRGHLRLAGNELSPCRNRVGAARLNRARSDRCTRFELKHREGDAFFDGQAGCDASNIFAARRITNETPNSLRPAFSYQDVTFRQIGRTTPVRKTSSLSQAVMSVFHQRREKIA
jgi:hypothetical protein